MVAEFIDASLNSELTKGKLSTLSDEGVSYCTRQERISFPNKVEIGLKFVEFLEDKQIQDSQNPENDPAYKASQDIFRDVPENKESVISISNFLYDMKSKIIQ